MRYDHLMRTEKTVRSRMSRIDVMDDAMIPFLLQKTEWERLEVAFGMWEMAEHILSTVIASENPGLDPSQIRDAVARRMAHECP